MQKAEYMIQDTGFRIQGSYTVSIQGYAYTFRIMDEESRIHDLGCRDQDSGYRVQNKGQLLPE
jgi:hypothetical protein